MALRMRAAIFGLLQVVIFSTDNGGNTDTGGNNSPLRGQKATTWEGGVRGVGWVGGGLPVLQRAAVSRALMHVSDWYPTIVHGIAGLDVGVAADGTPPLDGLDAWPAITTGAPSLRNEILLNLQRSTNHESSPRVQGPSMPALNTKGHSREYLSRYGIR